ncbi:MAG: DUF3240 family protein [Deltaproteobacteria bacterium]|nr:DUF3240 family protein [Deltaproteobacteria bacterium]
MKLLTIIIHEQAKQNLIEILNAHKEVDAFTIINAEGHIMGSEGNPFETTRDLVSGYVPRVRFDIVLKNDALEDVVDRITYCQSCIEGTGVWYVTDIDDYAHF